MFGKTSAVIIENMAENMIINKIDEFFTRIAY